MAYKLSATLYVTISASDRAHADRDVKFKPYKELQEKAPVKGLSVYYDLYQNDVISKEINDGVKPAEQRLVAEAKKLGLKPVGAPDIAFSIYGDEEGAIEYEYHMRAE